MTCQSSELSECLYFTYQSEGPLLLSLIILNLVHLLFQNWSSIIMQQHQLWRRIWLVGVLELLLVVSINHFLGRTWPSRNMLVRLGEVNLRGVGGLLYLAEGRRWIACTIWFVGVKLSEAGFKIGGTFLVRIRCLKGKFRRFLLQSQDPTLYTLATVLMVVLGDNHSFWGILLCRWAGLVDVIMLLDTRVSLVATITPGGRLALWATWFGSSRVSVGICRLVK